MIAPTHPLPARLRLAAAALVVAALAACSDVADDPLPPTGPAARSHPAGWLQSGADDFHGNAIRQQGWDMTQCRSCHGSDYAGGFVEVSCLTCHPASPEGCDVCHGGSGQVNPPEDLSGSRDPASLGVGAHTTHLSTALTLALDCVDCHILPDTFDAPTHLDGDGRAEVRFGARATAGEASPSYDPVSGSCAGTYCHGGGKYGNGAAVVWNQVDTGQAACGTCHGLPPAPETGHVAVPSTLTCNVCHSRVVDADLNIIDPALHMNGQTDL